ncbi:MAG: hypothetical protein HZA78_00600 [Candidatus Schekmanbacteria bacterium]|nr:hypothetical protein [Candidatus Schekmanbacteria bacterium]
MASNFLEQLVAEWYEYAGYFIRRNVLVGKLPNGGYCCELDIVAFHPEKKHLLQIEPSMDADSWAKREKRFSNKFKAGRDHIPELFKGFDLPSEIEQIALLGFASNKNHQTIGGGQIKLISELLEEIFTVIKTKDYVRSVIPENYTIFRAFQVLSHFGNIEDIHWKHQ